MYSLNRVQLIGNLTRDPELRQTTNGQNVASFGVATNRVWNDASGQKQEQVEYHNVVVWGKLAEIAGSYLKKGRKVFVEGRLQTREWTGDDGQKRFRTEIVCENFIILDRSGNPESGNAYMNPEPSAMSAPKASAPVAQAMAEEEMSLDDLPF
jgi:single-strand DNA-binding protein